MGKFVLYFLKNKALTWLLLVLVLCGGVLAYSRMGKLEDAPFTIKQALITTPYPGASPFEVQTQVTDVLEEAVQSLGEVYYLKTENRAGLSKITVYVKKEIRADDMQQLWDKLRRKVNDVQASLPAGAGPSRVNDDFGDVLGIFYGIYGAACSNRDLEKQAECLKNELLKVDDVARVELCGVQTPVVEICLSQGIMATAGITADDVRRTIDARNVMVDAGALEIGANRLRIQPAGAFESLDEIRDIQVVSPNGTYFRMGDIAEIRESYSRPLSEVMRIDNLPAVGIAVSAVPDGNVVDMSEQIRLCVDDFRKSLPAGMSIAALYDQGQESAAANNGFVLNLILSVLTVVAVLLFFIGFKNGLLIGSGLVFTIFATLIYMWSAEIALQRMSLAAIIIAMGMLVDNAIVVSDSVLVDMQRGMRKRVAIQKAVRVTAMPLLAATLIAILTFMPVYLSPHITGELLSSLFIVIAVSLLLSWIFAMVQTPFFMQELVRRPRPDERVNVPFAGKIYVLFRRLLHVVIRYKWLVLAGMLALLSASATGFRKIPKVFMPQLDKRYFTVDMWLPEGMRIEYTDSVAKEITEFMYGFPAVRQISAFVGKTPPRYYLANSAFGPQSNYAQYLVEAESPGEARNLQVCLSDTLPVRFPEAFVRVNRFELNSIPQAMIEARFCGPDAAVLDSMTGLALDIMRCNSKVMNARGEWGNMAMNMQVDYDPVRAGRLEIGKKTMLEATKAMADGVTVGIYRDGDKQIPVRLRAAWTADRPALLGDIPVWNGNNAAPLSQAAGEIRMAWEWPLVKTYDRQVSMSAMCDARPGATMSEVHAEIREEIEGLDLPDGYSFFWDAQYKDQKEAMAALTRYFPLAILLIVLILVALFRNFRQPLVVLLMLPLSLTGMIAGLLLTGFDFGFFCIAGWLGLLGMIIKNVIVLIDEINCRIQAGDNLKNALVEATVSRARPVLMAAMTTVCGTIPLLFDVVFGGMAATIVFGLTFATLLTLFVAPALYAVLYRVK